MKTMSTMECALIKALEPQWYDPIYAIAIGLLITGFAFLCFMKGLSYFRK